MEAHTHEALKEKQRTIRSGFSQALTLRVHRALSWLGRAEDEVDDDDVRFILLWVGFNAAYAEDIDSGIDSERGAFRAYFETLVTLDKKHRIYNAVWERFPHEIRVLLNNKFVFAPFWQHVNGADGYGDWEDRLAKSHRSTSAALTRRDTPLVLSIVFDRLYVLRNQLVHGGATWNGAINRGQVRDGAAVLGWLLPIFIDIMMDNPDRDWGKPYYLVVEDARSHEPARRNSEGWIRRRRSDFSQ